MSYSIDVNIFVHAANPRDKHHQQQAICFLEEKLNDSELLFLPWMTLMSYQRITTHPSVFPDPLTPKEAWKNIEDLLALPQVRIIGEDESFAHHYLQATSEFPVRGNLVSDAHLAAILRQHGVKTIYSADSDFRKFSFLKVINPLR
ncbi:MAG: TA system VapC family ribonuclease toxin [Verrucomicrobiota bacterium]